MASRFNAGDRRRLRQALVRAKGARRFRRLQTVLWVAEGRSVTEVARLARASRVSVYAWCAAYGRRPRGQELSTLLAEKPRSGRPRWAAGRLRDQALQELLGQSPLTFGYQSPGWTLPLLATHLQKRSGGPRPSRSTLRRRLHALGWRWKRPRYVFLTPDPERAKKNARY
jgi:transposase